MAVILGTMDKPQHCYECNCFIEGGCIIMPGSSCADETYDQFTEKFTNCPLVEIEVDVKTFAYLQEQIVSNGLTATELPKAIRIVIEERQGNG